MTPFRKLLGEYANWDGAKSICITVDVDFAPDYMIQPLAELFESKGIAVTFFATHHSNLLSQLSSHENFEVGIHPNLAPNSTQGVARDEIVQRLLSSFPETVSNRFHRLGYAYADLKYLSSQGIKTDVSTIRYNAPFIVPVWHRDLDMVLLSYTWEDGVCADTGVLATLADVALNDPGLKIINFHPMNTYLNFPTLKEKERFKSDVPNIYECAEDLAQGYRSSGDGAMQVLEDLVNKIVVEGWKTFRIGEIGSAFRAQEMVL